MQKNMPKNNGTPKSNPRYFGHKDADEI